MVVSDGRVRRSCPTTVSDGRVQISSGDSRNISPHSPHLALCLKTLLRTDKIILEQNSPSSDGNFQENGVKGVKGVKGLASWQLPDTTAGHCRRTRLPDPTTGHDYRIRV